MKLGTTASAVGRARFGGRDWLPNSTNFAYHFSYFLHPRYLWDHTYNFTHGFSSLVHQSVLTNSLLLIPLTIVAGVVARRVDRAIGTFTTITLAGSLLGYGLLYWVTTRPINEFVHENVDRLVIPLVLAAATLLPLLAASSVAAATVGDDADRDRAARASPLGTR